jgi:hypothetical protein
MSSPIHIQNSCLLHVVAVRFVLDPNLIVVITSAFEALNVTISNSVRKAFSFLLLLAICLPSSYSGMS